ncbi:MAG: cyclic nucleotide-binding domain-containing protein [Cyclobacteriaceae bacterium]
MQKEAATDPITWQLIRGHPVFHGIDDNELLKALPYFRTASYERGEVLMEEGLDSGTDLYLILEGKLEVAKKAKADSGSTENEIPEQFVIAQLNAGDSIGELSFVKGDRRSASVKCLSRAVVLGLSPINLLKLQAEYPGISTSMMKNMVGYVGDRLRRTSENEVRALKLELQHSVQKSKANLFFSYVICLLCGYNITLELTSNFATDANRTSIVSAIIVITFGVVLYLMTRQSRLPMSNYGLTAKNWKPALKESLLWSAVIIAVLVMTKWILIENVEKYQNLPLIDFDLSKKYPGFNFLLYGLHCPVQEFVARGVLQSSLARFFTGKNVALRAVLVSNALFSATHIHVMGGFLGIVVFVPGLFWGWLFSRHENLIGVSVSHLLIGWTALFFLNLESLF